MKVLKHVISTGENTEIEYPNRDINEPIYRLDTDIELYFINESKKPNFNELLQDINYYYELTDIISEYPHLKQANKKHNIVNKPNSQIINQLNKKVGELIEENIPIWKQIKYSELLGFGDITDEMRQYYKDILQWKNDCRAERDKKENELLTNGILPDLYTWPEMPIKPE